MISYILAHSFQPTVVLERSIGAISLIILIFPIFKFFFHRVTPIFCPQVSNWIDRAHLKWAVFTSGRAFKHSRIHTDRQIHCKFADSHMLQYTYLYPTVTSSFWLFTQRFIVHRNQRASILQPAWARKLFYCLHLPWVYICIPRD